MHQIIAE